MFEDGTASNAVTTSDERDVCRSHGYPVRGLLLPKEEGASKRLCRAAYVFACKYYA